MIRIGVIGIQGAIHAHEASLMCAASAIGALIDVHVLRHPEQISNIDGFVMPGGESTAMRLAGSSILSALFERLEHESELPVLATCAGAILLADPGGDMDPLIDVEITRNAWGRQKESFEASIRTTLPEPPDAHSKISTIEDARELSMTRTALGSPSSDVETRSGLMPAVFIRAPKFGDLGPSCEAIAWLGDEVVGVRSGHKVAVSFHPELTSDFRIHLSFIQSCLI